VLHPRMIAEARFKLASGKAALFELRMRTLAGTIPGVQDEKIDVNLATVQQRVCQHYHQKLTAEETELFRLACKLRNKLLHCAFSTARRNLDEINPQPRTLRHVYGWLSECHSFGEFDEATTVFARANAL
jgi:hypothetical protein